MSRTEGITLPRLPARHARVTSSRAIQPHPAASGNRTDHHRRAISEPSYTAFVGSPRQDVPTQVYRDAAMFDDVFDKRGSLLLNRNTPKITSPLNSLRYSSLHDPHCQKMFLNNKKLRSHLMQLGLITEDLKVVATITEQRQKIRAHELLERREQLEQSLEDQEQTRISKLQGRRTMPSLYEKSLEQAEMRRERAKEIERMKVDKFKKSEKEKELAEKKRQEIWDSRLKAAMEESKLMDQARRNAARAQQEMAEAVAYQKRYGRRGHRMAAWHRESDRIHNQMVAMKRKQWNKGRPAKYLTFEPLSDESQSTVATGTRSGSALTPPRLPSIETGDHVTTDLTNKIPASHEEPSTTGGVMSLDEPEVGETPTGAVKAETPGETTPTVHEIGEKVGALEIQSDEGEKKEGDGGEKKDGSGKDEGVVTTSPGGDGATEPDVAMGVTTGVEPEEEEEEVGVLDPEQAKDHLINILIDMFNRGSADVSASGFISTEDYIKVLNSRDLGLQLNQLELEYLAEQSDLYKNGFIPVIQVVYQLPEALLLLYGQRAQQSMELYGVYPEEQWCEIDPPAREGELSVMCYLNKLTGAMQIGRRPQDFRPTLRDDAFEDAIVDFFGIADENRDGVIDYNDFCSLLVSDAISSRTYNNQTDELLTEYLDSCHNSQGWMTIEEFAPLARLLLLMIYQNTYPVEEEWIELESRKFGGNFFFNKSTGETFIPASQGEQPPQTQLGREGEAGAREEVDGEPRKRKRRSRHRRVSWSDDNATPIDQTVSSSRRAPPPLRRRQSKERREEDVGETAGFGTRSGTETDSTLDSVPEESEIEAV